MKDGILGGLAAISRIMAFATIAVLLLPLPARADTRVALVVGIGAYVNVPVLRNTTSDAVAVGAALERLGFTVDVVLDPNKGALDSAIRRFGEHAMGADAALFFYAGHALVSGGKNWIVPATANIHRSRDLPFETSDLDTLLEQLDGAARLSIIILDSCRDNPFRLRLGEGRGVAGSEGLAQMRAATGTLIEYATAPGAIAADGSGPHSPFTTALLHQIEAPGVEAHQVFADVRREVREATRGRQVPWETSAMEGAFYFRPPPATPPAAIVTAANPAPAAPKNSQARSVSDDAELLFWKSIADSRDPADFREYLSSFPKGLYAGIAANRIRQLAGSATLPSPAVAPVAPVAQAVDPRSSNAPDDHREALSNDALRTSLIAELPSMPDELRKQRVAYYLSSPLHRMFAANSTQSNTWTANGFSDASGAEEHGLERCEIYYGVPCMLLSVDQALVGKAGQPDRPRRDMPRFRYSGAYDPAQIPTIENPARARPDIAGYGSVAGPKAMAIHPWGLIFVATSTIDQPAAELKALNDCDDDPSRKGADGPCYLYAVGNKVVLPDRHVDPMDADAAYKRIEAAAARVAPAIAAERVADYRRLTEPKAMAAHVESARFFWKDNFRSENRQAAEVLVLEDCQQTYGSPCVLLAVGTELRAPDPATAPKRDMPRLHATGPFSPDNVPIMGVGNIPELQAYASLPGAKAIAIRAAKTRVNIASGAASVADAERKALAACNDPDPNFAFPCFIYASSDRVVLPERRTEVGP